jgi:type II secretory pathway pseudopilin PulG
MLLRRIWRIAVIAVLLFILVSAAIYLPGFIEARDRSMVARTHTDFRTIANALESYRLDHGAYPPPILSSDGWSRLSPALTTPVSYVTDLYRCLYCPQGETYGYALIADGEHLWSPLLNEERATPAFILISPGPMKETGAFRLDWNMVYDPTNGTKSEGYLYRFGG